jgi:tetratricopeptide (TPR) repeat protein
VSAAPLPKEPESPAEPSEAEGWALLENLRRRLDDQAVQGRKTQQQVTQLAESIGALVELQRRRARSLNLNSFVAYLIFTLLCGAGFYFVYAARADELASSRDRARKELDLAVKRADDATAKLAAREAAEQSAWEVHELLAAGKRAEATAKLAAADKLPLSRTERAVLAARAHEVQVMEVESALKAAVAAFKAGRHADVIAPLEAALVGEPDGARSASMRYYLGIAYAKGGQLDKAIAQLTAALAGEAQHEDVRFHLASALDRSGQYAKARIEYDRFATAHPQSAFAAFALRRSATLARLPAGAPPLPSGAIRKPAWKPKAAAPKPAAPAPTETTAPPPSEPAAPVAPSEPAPGP